MSDPRIQALLAMGKGRLQGARSPQWMRITDSFSPTARQFVECDQQGAIAIAGRGAAKSTGSAARFHRVAEAIPNQSSVFVALSADRARDILLPAIWLLNEKYNARITERRGEKAVVWPNGHRLLFRGCGDRSECDKRRGTPWAAAAWDECASIASALLELDIHECVEPRLVDLNGKWWAMGTPGPIQHGYWHKLSSGAAGYPVFQWDARENPYINALAFMLQTLQRMNGVPPRETWPPGCTSLLEILDNPTWWLPNKETGYPGLPARFVREYLGRWVQDLSALIYRLTRQNNYRTLPIEPDYTTIGVDLGSHSDETPHLDHSAITVAQSHSTLPTIWVPESRKLSNIDVELLRDELYATLTRFPDGVIQLDSASSGKLIERTFKKWGLPVQIADRGPKQARILLVQSQVDNGNLQLLESACMDLRVESTTLVWNDNRDDHSPLCADDGWDSGLYAITPHLAEIEEAPPKAPERGTPEYEAAEESAEYEEALREAADRAMGML